MPDRFAGERIYDRGTVLPVPASRVSIFVATPFTLFYAVDHYHQIRRCQLQMVACFPVVAIVNYCANFLTYLRDLNKIM
jgi:hypothetical protein